MTKVTTAAGELARLRSITMWQAVTASAMHDLDRDALVGANDAGLIRRLTYGELVERVRNLSAGLASIGVKRGDRVALWMTNTLEWVVSAFATMRLGAALVPVNTFLTPPEIKYCLVQSGARHLIMIDGFRALNMPNMLCEICPEVATAKTPGDLWGHELPDLRNIVLFRRGGGRLACAFDFETLARTEAREAHEIAERMEREVRSTDLAMVKYTSGSTGFPKGVMLEQGGIVANGILHSRRIGAVQSDIYFSMMPFFHAGGSVYGLMTMLLNGGTLIFTEAFNAALATELIARERPTFVFGVLGEEVVRAAVEKGVKFPSVRMAATPDDSSRAVYPNATFCFSAFGLTETYGPAAITCVTDPPEKRGTSGRLMDGNECRVVDPVTGRDVGPGVPGEAYLRGNVTKGYWNMPEQTARLIDKDGWLRSEDIISVDRDGYITFVGRLKLMLKVGGENVSLEEVERVVAGHDAVASCGAVGVPDKRKNEAVRVYVSLLPGQTLTEQELSAWLTSRLARFKMPRDIVFMEALPRLANGKLDRMSLAEMAKDEVAA
ncbi:MAG: long-chain fatty acid--CoA ligase [Rhodospirillaceae bacterium]|nr:MAG: long-chain fatty acid--CoA ligase [Rhodospirillaceae bacterium]